MSRSRTATIIISCWVCLVVADASAGPPASQPAGSPKLSIHLPGRLYEDDDDEFTRRRRGWLAGRGREFDLFYSRGGQNADSPYERPDNIENEKDDQSYYFETRSAPFARPAANRQQRPSSSSSPFSTGSGSGSNKNSFSRPTVFQSVQEWWTCNIAPTVKNWPRIQCRVEPTTTLKIRKTFRPLKTIVRLGADFNTQLGVWQFKSSWEDAIIGGKITLAGKELQLSKSWQLSVGKSVARWRSSMLCDKSNPSPTGIMHWVLGE